jgi:hypothetical protein
MRVAVLSDVISESGYLDAWLKYYANAVGSENIFLYSYETQISVATVLPEPYHDRYRQRFMIRKVKELLASYDIVLRVDVDEFLVPCNGDLKTYLQTFSVDYVTAHGFNVFQRNGEADLDFSLPLLQQRKFMFADTRVYKTCVTKIPLIWDEGFHFCNKQPRFHGLILLHLKHADQKHEKFWQKTMEKYSSVKEYYQKVVRRECFPLSLDNERGFDEKFLSLVHERNGLFRSNMESEQVNLLVPESWKVF